jgi:macrolide transport system ATP-binding/permease protein
MVVQAEGLTREYQCGDGEVAALAGVNLKIRRGESLAILGRSGSGKSTLLNLLGCLDRPTAGRLFLEGIDVASLGPDDLADIRSNRIGFVFQGFNLLPRATAVENVMLPLQYSGDRFTAEERQWKALEALDRVGLRHRAEHLPRQLSGGEQQRVAIARAIVNEPAILLADEPTGNLDTRTGAAVMEVFRSLNREGLTLVIVTHDPEVAAQCRRQVVVMDGHILSDSRGMADAPDTFLHAADHDEAMMAGGGGKRPRRRWRRRPRFLDTLQTSVQELRRNRMRTVLTALGVIIGVAAIISMVSIGKGATAQVAEQVAALGENVIMVERGSSKNWTGVRSGSGTADVLTAADAQAIAAEVQEAVAVSPETYSSEQVSGAGRNWKTKVYGEGPEYFAIRRWELASGEPFTDTDVRATGLVAVIGATVARELFGDEDPIDQMIRIRNVPFKVVGVLTKKGFSLKGKDDDDVIFIPYTTAMRRLVGTETRLHRINVQAADESLLPAAQEAIRGVLSERYKLPKLDDNSLFEVKSQAEIEEVATGTSRTMTLLLGALAGVSLLVGGVGIMNIMLANVSERTREIGIRMAVGAHPSVVLRQFLLEAVILSGLGGVTGVVLGVVSSGLASLVAGWPTVIAPDAIAAALGFSAAVGITFGFVPAQRASRLDPIEALRRE